MKPEELVKENESLKEEIDEALSRAHWCDSTNNHGRDSVVELVDYLIHLHKGLVDDCVSPDKEVKRLRAHVGRLSPQALTDLAHQKRQRPCPPLANRKEKTKCPHTQSKGGDKKRNRRREGRVAGLLDRRRGRARRPGRVRPGHGYLLLSREAFESPDGCLDDRR